MAEQDTAQALQPITISPEDRLVLIWPDSPPDPEDISKAVDAVGLTGRVLWAMDVQAIAIRATKAEGSTVGQCGDVMVPVFPEQPPILCHLAHGHTGMHSDGEATWTNFPQRWVTGLD